MRIIVTGSNGYLGSNICKYLENNYNLIKPSRAELYDKNYWQSLTNQKSLIIHTAAVTGWRRSEEYDSNLSMLSILMDYCSASGSSILFFSSIHDKGNSAYGSNKIAQINKLKKAGINYHIVRLAHVIGGEIKERNNYFINHFIQCFCKDSCPSEISSDAFGIVRLNEVLLLISDIIKGKKLNNNSYLESSTTSARSIWEIISKSKSKNSNEVYTHLLREVFDYR